MNASEWIAPYGSMLRSIEPWRILVFAYLGIWTWAHLLIIWRRATSDWRVARRIRKIGRLSIHFRIPDGNPHASPATLIVVHGTGALRGAWHQRGSEFFNRLEEKIQGRCKLAVHRFLWSGGNTATDRDRAAHRLSEVILETKGKVVIVAHSHGGNIALRAVEMAVNKDNTAFERVVRVVTVCTPFLAAMFRSSISAWTSAVFASSLLVVGATLAVMGGFESSSIPWLRMAGVAAVILLVMYLISLRLQRKIGNGFSDQLLMRTTVIRAAGDEAGAALGLAYVLGYAGRVLSRIVSGFLTYPAHVFESFRRGESDPKARVGEELLQLLLGFTGSAVTTFLLGSLEHLLLRVPVMLLGAISLWNALSVLVIWSARLVRNLVSGLMHGVTDAAMAIVLLPFGPEAALAAPFVIISAEAVPASNSPLPAKVETYQLAPKEVPMQHAFERHAPDIAGIVARYIPG